MSLSQIVRYGFIVLAAALVLGLTASVASASGSAQASCPPANCTAGRDVDRGFFGDVVRRLKDVPYSEFAVDALMAWKPYENTAACWNPLATTWRMYDVCDFNGVGVQHFADREQGVRGTANTLNQGYYDAIRRMLRMEGFDREGMRGALGTWGTCRGTGCNSLLDQWQALWNRYSSGSQDSGPGSGYSRCAAEGERCNFGGMKDVAYGASGRWAFRGFVTGGIDCNNNVFGDPLPGVRKACWIKDVPGTGTPGQCEGYPGVYLYEHTNWQGRCTKLTGDASHPRDWYVGNDQASSIRMIGNWVVVLYEHDDYNGASSRFTRSDPDLRNNNIGNDRASSARVSQR
jgi:hypothetical protein